MTTGIIRALAVGIVCLAVPSWAGFEEGLEAMRHGDYVMAFKEMQPLAEKGDAFAQHNLGWMYEMGNGVPQDDQEALKWYRLSAHQGQDNAQHNLGTLYALGKGVPQDYTEAFKWYLLAAGNGNPLACGKLGLLYENGWGVPQDYVQAHMWFNLAGAFGLEQAFRSRDKLAIKMSSNQIAEAQQLAREWKPKGKATPMSQGTTYR